MAMSQFARKASGLIQESVCQKEASPHLSAMKWRQIADSDSEMLLGVPLSGVQLQTRLNEISHSDLSSWSQVIFTAHGESELGLIVGKSELWPPRGPLQLSGGGAEGCGCGD